MSKTSNEVFYRVPPDGLLVDRGECRMIRRAFELPVGDGYRTFQSVAHWWSGTCFLFSTIPKHRGIFLPTFPESVNGSVTMGHGNRTVRH